MTQAGCKLAAVVLCRFDSYPPHQSYGRLAERTKAAVLKTVGPKGPVGSNPTPSPID